MSKRFGRGLALICALWGAQVRAQSPLSGDGEGFEASPPPPKVEEGRGMPQVSGDCAGGERFGGSSLERAAYCQLKNRRFVSARTLADRALKVNEASFRAHYLMGVAQHLGEGNLPKALFHLERAESLFIQRHGKRPDPEQGPGWILHRTMVELVYVHGEMDHHEQKIEYVDLIGKRLNRDYKPLKAWPLLKLKRFKDARKTAKEAAEREGSWYRSVGLTALCAVESELRDRQGAYDACTAAARPVLRSGSGGAIELSNAGAAAEEIFKFAEAERMYTEATKREPEGSVNPWGRMVRLLLRQGRISEAIDAWKEMRAYRARRSGSYLDQQDQSEAELIGASVLMVVGRAKDAEVITERTVSRPDRQGTSSAAVEQNEAGAFIMDRVAKLESARLLEEEASSAKFLDALKLRARALKLRGLAWASGRKAAEVLAIRERLVTTLRPECPGSLELPSWLDGEVISLVGPGVALAAIQEAKKEETLKAPEALAIFWAFEAESYWLAGDHARALASAKKVVSQLSNTDALVRARVAAIGADAAAELGDHREALKMFRVTFRTDPGVIRRLGIRVPVELQPASQSAEVLEAIDMLEDSPLLTEEPWGFVLRVGAKQAQLLEDDGSMVLELRVPEGRREDREAIARRIARAVHRDLLVPQLDITQGQIKSLDGSMGSGGRASDRVRGILEEVMRD